MTYQLQFQPQVDLEQRSTAHRQLTGTEVVPRRGGFPIPLWVTYEASETQSCRGEATLVPHALQSLLNSITQCVLTKTTLATRCKWYVLGCQQQESIRYQLVMGLVASRYHGMHGIRMNTERTGKFWNIP